MLAWANSDGAKEAALAASQNNKRETTMIFTDFTVARGLVLSRRQHNTDTLVAEAIEVAQGVIVDLKKVGDGKPVLVKIRGLPNFEVTLSTDLSMYSVPDALCNQVFEKDARSCFFFCAMPSCVPFQFNCLLAKNGDIDADKKAAELIVELSTKSMGDIGDRQKTILEIVSSRPVLATTLYPDYPALLPKDGKGTRAVMLRLQRMEEFQKTVRICSDFSTCFAAALLLDKSK